MGVGSTKRDPKGLPFLVPVKTISLFPSNPRYLSGRSTSAGKGKVRRRVVLIGSRGHNPLSTSYLEGLNPLLSTWVLTHLPVVTLFHSHPRPQNFKLRSLTGSVPLRLPLLRPRLNLGFLRSRISDEDNEWLCLRLISTDRSDENDTTNLKKRGVTLTKSDGPTLPLLLSSKSRGYTLYRNKFPRLLPDLTNSTLIGVLPTRRWSLKLNQSRTLREGLEVPKNLYKDRTTTHGRTRFTIPNI